MFEEIVHIGEKVLPFKIKGYNLEICDKCDTSEAVC
jgi:hypothetical protein